MTTVADEGNRRKGDMSIDEMEQCIQDIKSWFMRSKSVKIDTASSADLQMLEKTVDVELPKILKLLLLETNGSLWFMDKKAMNTQRILEVVSNLEETIFYSWLNVGSRKWRNGLIPFAGDEGMGMLVVDTSHGTSVHEWDEDDGVSDDPVAYSLASYFEDYRNQLLSGKCEFLGDAGVVEKMSKLRK